MPPSFVTDQLSSPSANSWVKVCSELSTPTSTQLSSMRWPTSARLSGGRYSSNPSAISLSDVQSSLFQVKDWEVSMVMIGLPLVGVW